MVVDTTALQEAFEWVRAGLGSRYTSPFEKATVVLRTGGTRTFNGVSADQRVVGTTTTSSGPTPGGKKPVGKGSAIAELYYLTLARAETRLLVVTEPAFIKLLDRELHGALDPGVELVHVPLPALTGR